MFVSQSLPGKGSTRYNIIIVTIIIIIINVVIAIHNVGNVTRLNLLALWFQVGLRIRALTDDFGTTLES
jgi:uncharacterized integral membrane protein